MSGHTLGVASARFSRDGLFVITASDDKQAGIWSADDRTAVITLEGHMSLLQDAVFDADHVFAITASYDGTARVWDVATGRLLWSIPQSRMTPVALAVDPRSQHLLTASCQAMARWDLGQSPVSDATMGFMAECRISQSLDGGRTSRYVIEYLACRSRARAYREAMSSAPESPAR